VLIFLNRRAGHGRAAARWDAVRPWLEAQAGAFDVEDVRSYDGAVEALAEAAARGERTFIAAGGDGTVNLLVNAIMALENSADVVLGAIGLGSSNDFHKPFRQDAMVAGVPVRVDCGDATARDVIRIDFDDDNGIRRTRFAILNASLGITAESNASFNAPTRLIRTARCLSVDAAIVASIFHVLATYRDIVCRLRIDGRDLGVFAVSNLGVIKSPHFAGSLTYDTPIEPDDGVLGVNLCERLTRFQALATVAALTRRRFRGRPKTRSWTGRRVSVETDRSFALETDGEIVRARGAQFEVIPRRIRCCR
jgi:diacylglycerol kinase (ATP)